MKHILGLLNHCPKDNIKYCLLACSHGWFLQTSPCDEEVQRPEPTSVLCRKQGQQGGNRPGAKARKH